MKGNGSLKTPGNINFTIVELRFVIVLKVSFLASARIA